MIQLGHGLSDQKDEIRFCCPFCTLFGKANDSKYHLYVNTEKRLFHCFRCGVSGSIGRNGDFFLKNVAENKKYSSDLFSERHDMNLLGKVEIEKIKKEKLEKKKEKSDIVLFPKLYEVKGVMGEMGRSYWEERGFSEEDAIIFDIRFSEENSRIVIPIKDSRGTVVFYIQRAIEVGMKPRYIFSVGANKKDYLYNIHNAKLYKEIFIFEGTLDVISAGQNSVALLGKFISEGQIEQLKQSSIDKVHLMLDKDVSRRERTRVKEKLRMIVDVREVQPPDCGDMNDLLREKGREGVDNFLKEIVEDTS